MSQSVLHFPCPNSETTGQNTGFLLLKTGCLEMKTQSFESVVSYCRMISHNVSYPHRPRERRKNWRGRCWMWRWSCFSMSTRKIKLKLWILDVMENLTGIVNVTSLFWGQQDVYFPGRSTGKESTCSRRPEFSPEFREFPGTWLNHSVFCVEDPMDERGRSPVVHEVTRVGTWLSG